MLMCLLIFEMILMLLIILTHQMILQKYKEIQKSVTVYTSKRVYKTTAHIAFIDQLIKRYQYYIQKKHEIPELETMVRNHLLQEHIGRFSFIGVSNVAQKVKYIMWGIIGLEVVIMVVNRSTQTLESVIVIAASVLLTIIMEIYSVTKALKVKQEALIALVSDYILNTYPIELLEQLEEEKRIQEINRVNKAQDSSTEVIESIQDELKEDQAKIEETELQEEAKTLSAREIAQFIKQLG